MASIITATTTGGLTQSADNSGVLQLASGTGNLVTIPSVTGTAMVSANMPAFHAYQSTQQTGIAAATFTKVNFQTEEFDTNNNFANSTFTPTVAGYYQINGNVWGAGNILSPFVSLYKNGARYKEGTFAPVPTTVGEFGANISVIVYMNGSTDYLDIYIWANTSSGTVSLQSNPASTGQLRVWFSGALIRGA